MTPSDRTPRTEARLDRDHPKSRWHREVGSNGNSSWACIPLTVAIEAEAASPRPASPGTCWCTPGSPHPSGSPGCRDEAAAPRPASDAIDRTALLVKVRSDHDAVCACPFDGSDDGCIYLAESGTAAIVRLIDAAPPVARGHSHEFGVNPSGCDICAALDESEPHA